MAERTSISYANGGTFNPWRGCRSAELPDGTSHSGCKNCYARCDRSVRAHKIKWGAADEGGTRVKTSANYWRQPLLWNLKARAAGERRRVLCPSLSDLFENWTGPILDHKGRPLLINDGIPVEDDWGCCDLTMSNLRRDVFNLIDQTPWLNWLITTKRPWNVRSMWSPKPPLTASQAAALSQELRREYDDTIFRRRNVWLGVSVSDQQTADAYREELKKLRDLVPVLWVPYEPALGPVNWRGWDFIDWIAVGAESGKHRREFHWYWAAAVRNWSRKHGIPCYVKQGSATRSGQQADIPDDLWTVKEFPESKHEN